MPQKGLSQTYSPRKGGKSMGPMLRAGKGLNTITVLDILRKSPSDSCPSITASKFCWHLIIKNSEYQIFRSSSHIFSFLDGYSNNISNQNHLFCPTQSCCIQFPSLFVSLASTTNQTKQDLKRIDYRNVLLLITEFCNHVALLLLEYAPTVNYPFTYYFLVMGTGKRDYCS